jgi:hypothetical protein
MERAGKKSPCSGNVSSRRLLRLALLVGGEEEFVNMIYHGWDTCFQSSEDAKIS